MQSFQAPIFSVFLSESFFGSEVGRGHPPRFRETMERTTRKGENGLRGGGVGLGIERGPSLASRLVVGMKENIGAAVSVAGSTLLDHWRIVSPEL